jgi:hypothetical protein
MIQGVAIKSAAVDTAANSALACNRWHWLIMEYTPERARD